MRILVTFNDFAPDIEMDIDLPEDQDGKEYIDRLLRFLIAAEFHQDMAWEPVISMVRKEPSQKRKQGRPATSAADIPRGFRKLYPQYLDGTLNISQYARCCGLSRPTVYKYLHMLQEEQGGKE